MAVLSLLQDLVDTGGFNASRHRRTEGSGDPCQTGTVRSVVILGSTGSIGTQTLGVISTRRREFMVDALAAGGSNPRLLAQQVLDFAPLKVAIADEYAESAFWSELDDLRIDAGLTDWEIATPEVTTGEQAVIDLAAEQTDVVVNAITGAAGLKATLATLEAGTKLALANKESLVIGGRLVTETAGEGQLIPIDSEHSAFAQSLRGGRRDEVRRLILTASGGPFRGRTREQLAEVTAEQALAHPTWNMGRVITINSATLVNKGLELIEAALLYDIDYDDIEVVVHPQSMIHSGVEFIDGAFISQASPPDMRLPIGLALTWPNRLADAARAVDWRQAQSWTFEPVNNEVFPAVELARRAGKAAGTAPAVYNGANEACVDAFCAGELSFLGIVDTIAAVLDEHLADGHVNNENLTLDAVLGADAWARQRANELIKASAA